MALAFYGFGMAWFCARRLAVGLLDETTVRTYLGFVYVAALLFDAVCVAWMLFKEVRLLDRWNEGRADELKCVVLVVAGLVPLQVARLLAPPGSVAALLGATACYMALAVLGRMHSPKGLSCPLLPLLVGAALSMVAHADTSMLPSAEATDWLLSACSGGLLDQLLVAGAMPVVEGFSLLLGGPVANALTSVLQLAEGAAAIPSALVDVLCFYPGVFFLASLMGVAASVLERVRPQLVEDARRVVAAERDAVRTGCASDERSDIGEGTVATANADVPTEVVDQEESSTDQEDR